MGRRALTHRAQASALYLFFYYIGSSVSGPIGASSGAASAGPGVVGMIAVVVIAALGLAARLATVPPIAVLPEPVPQRS